MSFVSLSFVGHHGAQADTAGTIPEQVWEVGLCCSAASLELEAVAVAEGLLEAYFHRH